MRVAGVERRGKRERLEKKIKLPKRGKKKFIYTSKKIREFPVRDTERGPHRHTIEKIRAKDKEKILKAKIKNNSSLAREQ